MPQFYFLFYSSVACWGLLALSALCVGSFLNMLIYRLPQIAMLQSSDSASENQLTLSTPRSFCPHCHTSLCWYDLIPLLGWCLQRGYCRHCQHPISWRYLIIEGVTLIYSIACIVYWGPQAMGFAMLLFGYLAILMICLDWQYQWLPDSLNYILLWSGLLLASLHITAVAPSQAIIAAASAYLLLWLINQAYLCLRQQHGIGGGDMKLLAALGAWCGLPDVLVVLWLGVIITLLCAFLRMALGNFQWRQRIAFAPGLLLAAGLVLLAPSLVHSAMSNLL